MSRRLRQQLQAEREHQSPRRPPERSVPRRVPRPTITTTTRSRVWDRISDSSDDSDEVVIPARPVTTHVVQEAPRTEWQRFQTRHQARREEEERQREFRDYQVVPLRPTLERERIVPYSQRMNDTRYDNPWRDTHQQDLEFLLADRNAERRYEAGREMRMYQDRNDQRRYDFAMEQIRNLDRITSARAQAFQAANEARRQREADKFAREQEDDARIREMRNYRRQKVLVRKDQILEEFNTSPSIDKIYVSERCRESYMEGEPNYEWSQLFLGVRDLDTSKIGRIRIIFNNGERYDLKTNGMYYKVERIGDLAVVRFFRLIGGNATRSWWSPSTWYEACFEDHDCDVA